MYLDTHGVSTLLFRGTENINWWWDVRVCGNVQEQTVYCNSTWNVISFLIQLVRQKKIKKASHSFTFWIHSEMTYIYQVVHLTRKSGLTFDSNIIYLCSVRTIFTKKKISDNVNFYKLCYLQVFHNFICRYML